MIWEIHIGATQRPIIVKADKISLTSVGDLLFFQLPESTQPFVGFAHGRWESFNVDETKGGATA